MADTNPLTGEIVPKASPRKVPVKFPNTAWFTEARFGMFIHWGLYAMPARGEWIRHHERDSNEAYDA